MKTYFLLGLKKDGISAFKMYVTPYLHLAVWLTRRTKKFLKVFLTLCKQDFQNLAIVRPPSQKQSAILFIWLKIFLWTASRIMMFLVLFTNISSVCLPLMREKKQENFIPRTKFHCLCQKLLRIIWKIGTRLKYMIRQAVPVRCLSISARVLQNLLRMRTISNTMRRN